MTYADRILAAKAVCRKVLEETEEQQEIEREKQYKEFHQKVEDSVEKIILEIERGAKLGQTLYKYCWFDNSDFIMPKNECGWITTEDSPCELSRNGVAYSVVKELEKLRSTGLRVRPMRKVYKDEDYGGLVTDYWLEVTI